MSHLGDNCTGRVREIYQGAATNIDEPKNLEKIITTIDGLDWFSAREEGLGNLYTVLRLPTGIFYAQGVKTNVLFFTRGKTDKGNTREVWFYDLRTNMPSFGKTNPLKTEHFAEVEAAYEAPDRHAVQNDRWSVFTREQIAEKIHHRGIDQT